MSINDKELPVDKWESLTTLIKGLHMPLKDIVRELEIQREEYWDDDGYGNSTKEYEETVEAYDTAVLILGKIKELMG